MYYCLECGNLFEEEECWEERHEFDYGPFEEWSGCPECGGSYVETYECDCCGKWITGSYAKLESGERICENCFIIYDIGDED